MNNVQNKIQLKLISGHYSLHKQPCVCHVSAVDLVLQVTLPSGSANEGKYCIGNTFLSSYQLVCCYFNYHLTFSVTTSCPLIHSINSPPQMLLKVPAAVISFNKLWSISACINILTFSALLSWLFVLLNVTNRRHAGTQDGRRAKQINKLNTGWEGAPALTWDWKR